MTDRGWTDMFGALREREFDRLLTGQVVSTTGEAMIPVALSFAVLDMTDSPADVGIVLAAGVVPFSLLALGGAPVTVIVTASFAGISLAIFQIVWQTALQEHVPQAELSRVTAWNWLGLLVFFPLGLVLAGPVSDVLGVAQTLWVSAATILVLVLVGLSVPSMRNLPSRAAEAQATAPVASADERRAEG